MPRSKYSAGLEGRRFNRTVILSFAYSVRTPHEIRYYWNCLCDCGMKHIADARSMVRGMIQSCGCFGNEKLALRQTHGQTIGGVASREINSWKKMKARVDNPNSSKWFYLYGGRGIRYCKGFSESVNFLRVMGKRPLLTSLDRIDTNGHYSCGECAECQKNQWPLNCRWATVDEQNSNKRNTIFLTVDGITKPLMTWAKEHGIPRVKLYHQFRASEARAIALLRDLAHVPAPGGLLRD